jgi:hypothetical protein
MRLNLIIAGLISTLFAAGSLAAEPAWNGLVVPVAAKTKVTGGKPQGGTGHPSKANPGVSYASTSVKCGSTVYQVSTGNGKGSCGAGESGRPSSERSCSDGKGNSASASCGGGCGPTKGSGSCKVVSE